MFTNMENKRKFELMNKKRILVFLEMLLVIFTCKCINVLAEIDEVELKNSMKNIIKKVEK